jgi:outer membrane protein assembly factor BamD (BamD/ComL family)
MSETTLEQEIVEVVHKLTPEMQRKALEYLKNLSSAPRGTPGYLAIQYAREIGFAREDLAQMEAAVNEMKQQIDDFPEVEFDER